MKKILTLACLAVASATAFAQGEVKFSNSTSFPIANMPTRTTGTLSTYYISALFMNTGAGGSFVPVAYGTNSAALAGVISAGSASSVPSTSSQNFYVATWSYALGGTDWSTVLANIGGNINSPLTTIAGQWFGISATGTVTPKVAGSPALTPDLWGAGAGQIGGFALSPVPVPEPSTYALMALGLGGLLFLRRRS